MHEMTILWLLIALLAIDIVFGCVRFPSDVKRLIETIKGRGKR